VWETSIAAICQIHMPTESASARKPTNLGLVGRSPEIIDSPEIKRQRTAIRRYRASRPISLALSDGLIGPHTSVLDYGCGYGEDVRFLCTRGVDAVGWDPNHRPSSELRPSDVVNLGFVLNVIEDPPERTRTLVHAFALAQRVLVVAVRVDRSLEGASEFGDGLLTNASTFQKLYTHSELREYVQSVLGRPARVASLGIVYVFKRDEDESGYLATRAFERRLEYRTDLIEEFSNDKTARKFVSLATRLGRMPLASEFRNYAVLLEKFGSANRVERLTLRQVDATAFEGSRAQRRDDILAYFAMLRLQGLRPPPLSCLPESICKDIKSIWKSYGEAMAEGDAFLFSIGRSELVRTACGGCGIGKLVATDLYLHRTLEDELPVLVRLIVFAARRVVGDLEYDLLKIATDGRGVSFLRYPNFDSDPHPALGSSVRVNLAKASYELREYGDSLNPPILHRKDALVGRSYPYYTQFRNLTEVEEELGLLSLPDIGRRMDWMRCLSENGLVLQGHTIERSVPPSEQSSEQ
jgi:DNA phosphorothioation-associated putative methyltransferase